jgi:hypothetical protein
MTKSSFYYFVKTYCQSKGYTDKRKTGNPPLVPGDDWFKSFVKRNKIKFRIAESITKSRFEIWGSDEDSRLGFESKVKLRFEIEVWGWDWDSVLRFQGEVFGLRFAQLRFSIEISDWIIEIEIWYLKLRFAIIIWDWDF